MTSVTLHISKLTWSLFSHIESVPERDVLLAEVLGAYLWFDVRRDPKCVESVPWERNPRYYVKRTRKEEDSDRWCVCPEERHCKVPDNKMEYPHWCRICKRSTNNLCFLLSFLKQKQRPNIWQYTTLSDRLWISVSSIARH